MVSAAVKARRILVQIILLVAPVYKLVLGLSRDSCVAAQAPVGNGSEGCSCQAPGSWQDGVQRACAQAVPVQGGPERSQQAREVFKDGMQAHC